MTSLHAGLHRCGHEDAGAAVQLAGEGVPRTHGPESDDVRHEGAGRPEPDAPDRRRTLAVAENGGPGSGVRGGLRPGLGRPSDSAPRPPAPEAFVTGEENEEEQSDDRRATYGRTGVRKRRGGPMRTLALRRCARVLRSKPRHGHVLRLRGRVGQRRTGSTDRDGSDPPVQGPGTGSEAGVFAHPCPRSLGEGGRSRPIIPTREGGSAPLRGGGAPVRSAVKIGPPSRSRHVWKTTFPS